jgi:hypothetical protein
MTRERPIESQALTLLMKVLAVCAAGYTEPVVGACADDWGDTRSARLDGSLETETCDASK